MRPEACASASHVVADTGSTSRPTVNDPMKETTMKPLRRGARAAEGLLLLATIGIEAGGNYVLALTRGEAEGTEFQRTFARSGHGHAGSLATLGAVTVILAEQTELKGPALQVARWAVPASAVLMPAGFFLSSNGENREEPNELFVLVQAGAVTLAAGLVTLGGALVASAVKR